MSMRYFFKRRRKREEDLEEEIRSHLRMAERDQVDRGATVKEASSSARREFGNVGQVKEVTRDMWGWMSLERLAQDLRYAARVLRQSPAFTTVAVLSIALGVGANTAIFSLINAVMLKSLPVPDPNQLVVIGDPSRISSLSHGSGRTDIFSYPFYERFRQRNQVFSDVYASGRAEQLNVAFVSGSSTGSAIDQKPSGRFVTGNYFAVLGVAPLIGRTFTEQEVRVPGTAPVIVISYGYWERQFARNPAAIGEKLLINGSVFTIIGVTPRGFSGDIVGVAADMWIPITMEAQANPGHDYLKDEHTSWLLLMGRLKPGVSLTRAAAAVDVISPQILTELLKSSESAEGIREILKNKVRVSSGARGFSRLRAQFALPLITLMGIVGLVLLICCANVANLQLARAVSRSREMGLRVAVGAGQLRLVRQLLTESLMLSLAGGAVGLLFAFWGSHVLVRLVSRTGPLPLDVHVDAGVLLFTAAVSIFAGLLFGLAPAWKTTRIDVVSSLKESKSGQPDGFTRVFGKLLIISQIVFSLMLLVCAGLFIRTLQNLEKVDVGYARNGLLLVRIDPQAGGYKDRQVNQLARELLERLQQIPGVQAASVSENGLFSGTDSGTDAQIEGYTATKLADKLNSYDRVGPRYFEVTGARVIEGRGIGPQDTAGAPKVAVVNEKLARFYFPATNPIGRHISVGDGKDRVTFMIIGVVRDVKENNLRGPTARRFYLAYLQHPDSDPIDGANFEIRTNVPSASISEMVRRTIEKVNPSLPILSVESADGLIEDTLVQERMIAQLSGFFGALALVLAAIGLYGVMSYLTARRTMEIGIRFALGAERSKVVGMVLKDTFRLVVFGLSIGIVVSVFAARLFAKSLFGLSSFDPPTMILAAVTISIAAILAAYLPAWRASRVDPVIALRYE